MENLEVLKEASKVLDRMGSNIDLWKGFYIWAEVNHPAVVKEFKEFISSEEHRSH